MKISQELIDDDKFWNDVAIPHYQKVLERELSEWFERIKWGIAILPMLEERARVQPIENLRYLNDTKPKD